MRRSRTPAATSERISQFRGNRPPLPLGDKRVLAVLIPHLCFLPWALGTMHPWSQITSLALAIVGFVVALTAPYASSAELSEGSPPTADLRYSSPLRRLTKFPPFWLGLALLVYILAQAFNPSWHYTTNGAQWWLVHVPNLPWLPTSVDVPFQRFNIWRQFIIYASVWLTVCTVAIGLTRRRSLVALLTALAANGLVLAVVGFIVRLSHGPGQVLWLERRFTGATSFSAFIYRNHAGAYFAIIAAVMLALAARYRERAVREHARSSPALLAVLGALVMFFAVFFAFSRGATVLLGSYLVIAALAFVVHRTLTGTESTTPRVVTFTIAGMIVFVVGFALMQVDLSYMLDRFEQLVDREHVDVSITGRRDAHEAGRDMLAATWPQGVGAGGFRHLFPQYIRRFEASYNGGRSFWEHVHNDWLEIPIELGLVGSALILAGGAWWGWRVVGSRLWRRLPPIMLALGLMQTLLHATIDFPFQNPAILTTWLVVALIAVRYHATDSADVVR